MKVGVSLPDAPSPLAGRRVFTTNGVAFTVADLARRAQVGNRETFSGGARPTSAAQAEEAFRRSRGLLTADGVAAWLATWEIDADDLVAWTHDVAAGTSTATAWCALVCSGELDAITAAVASAAAAACELGAGPVDTSFDPADWTDRLVTARTSDASLTATLEAHRLDWTRLETTSVATQDRGVAEELRHQVLDDGEDLKVVALRAGCAVHQDDSVLAGFGPPGLRAALAGARAGDLVGPVPVAGGRAGLSWNLVSVQNRTDPSLADTGTRARAEASVRHDVITRAVARHVVA